MDGRGTPAGDPGSFAWDADPWIDPPDVSADASFEPEAGGWGVVRELAEQTSYGEVFLHDLIRRQRRLSLSVAALFLVLLFAVPLVNLALPALAALPLFGLPAAWLLLAVILYPVLWGLGLYFTTTARAIEDSFADLVR